MKKAFSFFQLVYFGLALALPLAAQEPDSALTALSLDELLDLKISAAAKYEQTSSEAPASVTIITSEDIKAYGYETLEDVFRNVRGFYTSYDRNYSYLGARGFSRPTDYNNRILLLLNGHTTNENYYNLAYIGSEYGLNLDMVERIEIVRGPSSALYGTSALFAIINVVTREGKAVDGLEVSAAAGSYGTKRGAAQFGREFKNGAEIMLAGRWSGSDGQNLYYAEYDDSTGNGIAKNLDADANYSLFGTLRYKNFSGQAFNSRREKGIPTGAFGINFNDPAAKTRDERRFAEIKYDGALSASKNLMGRVYYDQYNFRGLYPYEYTYEETVVGKWWGTELQFRWDPRPNNRFIIGAELLKHVRSSNRGRDETTVYFDGDFPCSNRSLYVQDEYQPAKNLALTLGLRLDKYPNAGTELSPRAAAVYHPFKSGSLKLLYGEAFRAPSVWESNSDVDVPAPLKKKLKPERIKTAEAVWEQRLTPVVFGAVSVYNYTVRDLIDRVLEPADGVTQFRNLDRAKAYGMEIEMSLRPKKGLRGFANYTYQHARDDRRKKMFLTNSPRHLLKLGLMVPAGNFFDAALEAQYETARRTVYKTATKSYLLANLRLATAPLTKKNDALKNFQLGLSVNNLFDNTYQTPGGVEHLQAGIAQNRRNYQIKLQCNLRP